MVDGAEFTDFAGTRWPTLVRAAVAIGCDFEEARDLAQTTLLRCYLSWARVQRARDRDAYVYRILLNCYRDSRRRRWWREQPTAIMPSSLCPVSPDPALDVAVADAVHRAMADLNERQRAVIVLRYFANLNEQQTATVLGIKPGTVKSRTSRALADLAASPHLSETAERGPQ